MKVAFIIFDDLTALDFVGVFDPLTRLRTMGFLDDFHWEVCARSDEVRDRTGLRFSPTLVGAPLGDFDAVVVPGGYGTRTLVHDEAFVGWMRTAAACRLKASVCTGSLLLGAAGFLEGRRATTHPLEMDALANYCGEVVRDLRVVEDGDVVTARGVTAAIDLGLRLCERIAGGEIKERIKTQMDYPYGE